MTEPAPTVLNDRYELHGLLGRGGMAEVYRGFDRVLRREVAVKVMLTALQGDVDRRRFESETRLLAGLNDPHLVTLLDAGVDETSGAPRPWLVMELVAGPTLASRLADGPLPADRVAAVGADLAGALAHVHASGIVHRDVKPANVLLTPTGGAKLADFGVARLMDEQSDLTMTGHTIGTAAYLAPEQVTGRPVSGASDVYALGLVLLEALTGQRTFVGTPTEAAIARIHRGPLIPVSLGAGWVRLLDAMTSSDPAARPGADQVAAQLAAVAAVPTGAPVAAPAGTDPTGTMAVPAVAAGAAVADGPSTRTRAALLAGAAVVATVALVIGFAETGTDSAGAGSSAGAVAPTTTTPKPTKDPSPRTTAPPPPSSTAPVSLTGPAKDRNRPRADRPNKATGDKRPDHAGKKSGGAGGKSKGKSGGKGGKRGGPK